MINLNAAYTVGLGLVVAAVLLMGLAMARRSSSLWVRGAVVLLTVIVAFRLAFVTAAWAGVHGYVGWILALGSVAAAGWRWARTRAA